MRLVCRPCYIQLTQLKLFRQVKFRIWDAIKPSFFHKSLVRASYQTVSYEGINIHYSTEVLTVVRGHSIISIKTRQVPRRSLIALKQRLLLMAPCRMSLCFSSSSWTQFNSAHNDTATTRFYSLTSGWVIIIPTSMAFSAPDGLLLFQEMVSEKLRVSMGTITPC